jgi:sulfotransferase family protein
MPPTPESTPLDFITIVSGLPRSGTSLMMQMLAAGGLPPLMDETRAADENNPRGYFEFEPVKQLRSDQSWLAQAQGRAVKIIHLLLRELPTDRGFEYRVLLMKRPIEEVVASQRKMLEREGKQSADAAMLSKIYQSQLAQVEEWMRAQPCFSFLVVNHHDLINNPLVAANEINAFLGGNLEAELMARAVDPELWRERGETVTEP